MRTRHLRYRVPASLTLAVMLLKCTQFLAATVPHDDSLLTTSPRSWSIAGITTGMTLSKAERAAAARFPLARLAFKKDTLVDGAQAEVATFVSAGYAHTITIGYFSNEGSEVVHLVGFGRVPSPPSRNPPAWSDWKSGTRDANGGLVDDNTLSESAYELSFPRSSVDAAKQLGMAKTLSYGQFLHVRENDYLLYQPALWFGSAAGRASVAQQLAQATSREQQFQTALHPRPWYRNPQYAPKYNPVFLVPLLACLACCIFAGRMLYKRQQYEFESRTDGGVVAFSSLRRANQHQAFGCFFYLVFFFGALACCGFGGMFVGQMWGFWVLFGLLLLTIGILKLFGLA
jgi:hypothetical protein